MITYSVLIIIGSLIPIKIISAAEKSNLSSPPHMPQKICSGYTSGIFPDHFGQDKD